MEKIVRINITNKCNLACSSCAIFGCPENNRFMDFCVYHKLLSIYSSYDKIAVVFEGGEPLLHPQLYLFLEYLGSLDNVIKVQLSTNGMFLNQHYDELVTVSKRLNLPIRLCINITSHILSCNPLHMDMCKTMLDSSLINKNVEVIFNVMYKNDYDKLYLENIIKDAEIDNEYCSYSVFKAIGRLKDSEYPKVYPQDGLDWECYATDGKFFGTDLVARADYEHNLESIQKSIPVFDIKNHRRMWRETIGTISDIGFKVKEDTVSKIETFQKQYIYDNINKFTENMYTKNYMSYADYYVSLFKINNEKLNDPFVTDNDDICARSLMKEFFIQLELMQTTENKEKFEMYKNLCIRTAGAILHLPVKKNIRTTENIECFWITQ